jgi:hypothetical protein
MKRLIRCVALLSAISVPLAVLAADAGRIADVAKRGAEVMPFDLKATTHIFTKSAQGGVQSVVAKDVSNSAQVGLVRKHLKDIQSAFLKGDFSGPSQIHGKDMPGLAQLQAARPGQIQIEYADVLGGARGGAALMVRCAAVRPRP